MPTLSEYEARGIDITLMTTEQLVAEGYITPANELPVVIDVPGDYRLRNGSRVTIHEIAPTTTLATSASNAKGSIWKKPEKMGINPEYFCWHISGKATFGPGDSAKDVVSKW